MLLRKTYAEICLKSFRHNIQHLKTLHQPYEFFCPMIKANAYGHGSQRLASELEKLNIKFVGVALVEEGVELREVGLNSEILCFAVLDQWNIDALIEYQLIPVISDIKQLELILKYLKQKTYKIHLKFDTGMSRLGIPALEWQKVKKIIEDNPQIQVQGICTHYLNAEDCLDQQFTYKQYQIFQEVQDGLKGLYQYSHSLNSASLLLKFQNCQQRKPTDWGARPGISIYGISPIEGKRFSELLPVMTFKSYIAQLHEIKKGDVVSYGGTWKASQNSLIATVSAGYADGVFRVFSNKEMVLLRGQLVPLVGTVCMDYIMLDVTTLRNKNLQLGEEVVFWGKQGNALLGVEDVAEKFQLSPYECVTRVGPRVPRVFVNG